MRGVDVGSDADALEMCDFSGGTLFDGNVIAVGDREIERGDGCRDVKGNVIFFGEDGDLVGTDFVGGVAVGSDAVRAGDDSADFFRFQEMTDHVVGDERERDAAFVEFPGSEARALKIRARFGNEDVEFFPLFECDADDPESGADPGGGERAGVALGHDAAVAGHEFRAKAADGFVSGLFFEMNLLRFLDHALLDFDDVESLRREFRETVLHAVERPEEIHGGGARFGDRKSTRLNSSHANISYAVFCLKKKKQYLA